MKASLIVKAGRHSQALDAVLEHLGAVDHVSVRASGKDEFLVKVDGDTVTVDALNEWFCENHDRGAPYPLGTLLFWSWVEDLAGSPL